jgi:hypothetical protein
MGSLFNIVMRIISSLLGVLLACLGGIWILQGLNIAFKVGFMVGDKQWVAWGALAVAIGVSQVIWSNTRRA